MCKKTEWDVVWYLAYKYLEGFYSIGKIFKDEEFARRFEELRVYIDNKLPTFGDGDVKNIYVVCEQD
ncbi:MAG: hypothetical protein IJA89_06555 [Clostridia bacterium]|nr:hypothetical protein [Clostridia bacterium]